MLRFAEELKPHSKISIEQPHQPVHWRATRALGGSAPLPHLVTEIFKDCQKDRRFVLKVQVYRALGHLRRMGNIIDGSLAISVLRKQLQSRQHDRSEERRVGKE